MSQTQRPFRRNLAAIAAAAALGFFALSGIASAQPKHARDDRIVFGHLHVHPTNADEHRKFWIETLGGTLAHVGTMEVAKFPDGLIEWISPSWGNAKPAGGTRGTTVDHVAFTVPSLRAAVDRAKAAGYPIVTRAELPATAAAKEKNGVAVLPAEKTTVAFVMGPDDFLVEFVESKSQKASIVMHHIHFATSQVAAMEEWYAKVTGAKRGKRGSLVDAAIPGTHLTFAPSVSPVVGTKGRVLDHIGFEVRNLEGFTKELDGMGIKVERFTKTTILGGLAIAYLTDPWGTYIELSEGLDKVE